MDIPIGVSDGVDAEQASLAAFRGQVGHPAEQPITLDPTIDDNVRDVNPSGPYSRAMLCAIIRRPAFAAAKCANPGLPRKLAEAPVKMIVPRPSGANRRAASRPTRNPPKQPTRQNSSNCSAISSLKSMRRLLPALKITTSAAARPWPAEIARSKRRTTSSSRVVSTVIASALPPAASMF